MTAKPFNLSDVLSITTGQLVSFRGMDGIYDILNHMTGDNLFASQLPRAIESCAPVLMSDHPWLQEMGDKLYALIESLPPGADVMLEILPLMTEFMKTLGSSDINILPLLDNQWITIDPIKEAGAIWGDDNVTIVHFNGEVQ